MGLIAEQAKRVPIVSLLSGYRRSQLRPDLVAGLVLATMLIPQGIAYAELTGLPAVTGIYTTIAALVAYSVFGPNRRLILGPDSSLAPVIAAIVLPLAANDAATAVALASATSLIAGVMCVVAGSLRLGVITELLSKPIRIGYLNGIAVLIFVSQVPKALGFSAESSGAVDLVAETVRRAVEGDAVPVAILVSLGSLAVILGLGRISRTLPGVVVAAAASIIAVAAFDLTRYGVVTVGSLPTGLPALVLPSIDFAVLPSLVVGSLAIVLVSFADTGALSTATALRSGERVDPNGEIRALGAANLLSGVLQGFPTSGSSSRTAVAISTGARTQLAGLLAGIGVLVIVVAFPAVVSEMPEPTLAAIVIAASVTLFDWKGAVWLFQVRKSEFLLMLGALLGVVLLGVLEGIGVAIVLSLANFVRTAWRPHSTELGIVAGIPGYHDRDRHADATTVPGLLMLRYDAPIFFANAPDFGRRLQEQLADAGRPIRRVLVVGNAITDIDSTGAEILEHVLDDLEGREIEFAFAGLKGPTKDRLRRYGLYERIGEENFFPNTNSAVSAHRREDDG